METKNTYSIFYKFSDLVSVIVLSASVKAKSTRSSRRRLVDCGTAPYPHPTLQSPYRFYFMNYYDIFHREVQFKGSDDAESSHERGEAQGRPRGGRPCSSRRVSQRRHRDGNEKERVKVENKRNINQRALTREDIQYAREAIKKLIKDSEKRLEQHTERRMKETMERMQDDACFIF